MKLFYTLFASILLIACGNTEHKTAEPIYSQPYDNFEVEIDSLPEIVVKRNIGDEEATTYEVIANDMAMLSLDAQFGRQLNQITTIESLTMNNWHQDRNSMFDYWGCGLRDENGWMYLGGNQDAVYPNLKATAFLNGVRLDSVDANPRIGQIDVGLNGIMWFEMNIETINTGAVFQWAGWVFIQYNWNGITTSTDLSIFLSNFTLSRNPAPDLP